MKRAIRSVRPVRKPGGSGRGQRKILDPRRHHPGIDHGLCRRVGRQRGAAGDRDRSQGSGGGHPVAGQRLYAVPRCADADRRRGRRSNGPPPHLRHRRRHFRHRIALVRPVCDHRPVDRGESAARRRGGVSHPELARHHRGLDRSGGARPGDRDLGRIFRHRGRDRASARGLDRRSRLLAVDFPGQSGAGAAHDLGRARACAGEPRQRGRRGPRLAGSPAWPLPASAVSYSA